MTKADAWSNFSLELCKKLVKSMCQRRISVIERNDAKQITGAVFCIKE